MMVWLIWGAVMMTGRSARTLLTLQDMLLCVDHQWVWILTIYNSAEFNNKFYCTSSFPWRLCCKYNWICWALYWLWYNNINYKGPMSLLKLILKKLCRWLQQAVTPSAARKFCNNYTKMNSNLLGHWFFLLASASWLIFVPGIAVFPIFLLGGIPIWKKTPLCLLSDGTDLQCMCNVCQLYVLESNNHIELHNVMTLYMCNACTIGMLKFTVLSQWLGLTQLHILHTKNADLILHASGVDIWWLTLLNFIYP